MTDSIVWFISALVLLFGCWLQTALGFGMAVVATPIIVIIKPEWVPVVLSITALHLSAVNAWNQRDALHFTDMAVPVLTRIPGTMAGIWLLMQLNARWLQILVALCVLLAVFISLSSKQFKATPASLGWAGFISGIMGTTTAIGGPPMALVMQHGDPRTVRANLSLYFTYSCMVSLAGYAMAGMLSWNLLLVSISFVPCALTGFFWGIHARGYIDGGKFRPLLLVLCSCSACLALVTALVRSGN